MEDLQIFSILATIKAYIAARRPLLKKAVSFAAMGLISAFVDFGTFALAIRVMDLPLVLANVLAWATAVSASYVLNSHTTFAAESGRKLNLRAYGTFVCSGLFGLAAGTVTLLLASYFVPVLFAKVIAIGASFIVNFTLTHFFVFGSSPERRPP